MIHVNQLKLLYQFDTVSSKVFCSYQKYDKESYLSPIFEIMFQFKKMLGLS